MPLADGTWSVMSILRERSTCLHSCKTTSKSCAVSHATSMATICFESRCILARRVSLMLYVGSRSQLPSWNMC
jgi:hypothetical protein